MIRKLTVSLLFVSLLISQAMIYTSRQSAAENTEMLDMAAMLPDSDVVVTMDFDRTLNIAAPSLLNQDAKKIEHLKDLMHTIENQIGISPYEIQRMAAGFKLPATESNDILTDSEFTVIVRTANSNGQLLDTWAKRLDAIEAFKTEQAPSRKYMDDFKMYRSFKPIKATPEKIVSTAQNFQNLLKKTVEISAALESLPKLTTDAKAVSNLKAKNKAIADSLNNYISILKADSDMQAYREPSVKLLNRWNAITIEDPQRAAKLAAILKEAKEISPAYKQKYDNAQRREALFNLLEPADEDEQSAAAGSLNERINSQLNKTLASLKSLPETKLKRTAELNSLAENLESLHSSLDPLKPEPEVIVDTTETAAPDIAKAKNIYDSLKQAEREENVDGKRMIVIDFDKMDDPQPDQKLTAGEPPKKKTIPDLAIGFLDDKTIIFGFAKTVTSFLKRDANYKNQKALEMLSSAQNSLFAFAVNSNLIKRLMSDKAKKDKKPANPNVFDSLVINSLTKDINIYGSVNYDSANVTNDITMSLGFFKERVSEISLPETTNAHTAKDPNVDDTFEIAGYQVGKDIFYDLLNSFKAVQASLTFRFEKKKVAELLESTPQIIDRIIADNSVSKKAPVKTSKLKAKKLESFEDLFTTPQFYIDGAKLLRNKN